MRVILSVWIMLCFAVSVLPPIVAMALPALAEYGANQGASSIEEEDDAFRPPRSRIAGRDRRHKPGGKAWSMASFFAHAWSSFNAQPMFSPATSPAPGLHRLSPVLRI